MRLLIGTMQSLSFRGCGHIENETVKRMNEEQWRIPDVTLPSSPDSPVSGLEVDPCYR